MPLGLMPGMIYEETEASLEPGEAMLLHSDGVAEAHSAEREMFGFPRLLDVVGSRTDGGEVIDRVLTELDRFTAAGLGAGGRHHARHARRAPAAAHVAPAASLDVSFAIASEPGNERDASERVAEAVALARARARAARAAEDGRLRGGDERDRARQPVAARAAGRDRASAPTAASSSSASPTRAASARSPRPRRPTSRRSSTGCRSRAAGASS